MTAFDIDCIVVGRNQERTLKSALERALASSYSRGSLHIYYLDIGSSDNSLEIARSMEGVTTIAVHNTTFGAAYNTAWRETESPFVQFLSANALLDPTWFEEAMSAMGREIGGVTGRCQPVEPHGSIFNWVDSLEWRSSSPGGGIGHHFLVRRELLEAIDGFDEQLRYGTALDFAHAATKTEWQLRTIEAAMCLYDNQRRGFVSWWKSGVVEGRGRTAVLFKEAGWPSVRNDTTLRNAIQRGGGTYLILLFGFLGWISGIFWSLILIAPAAILLLSPRIFHVEEIGEKYRLSPVDAAVYAWHLSCYAMPQCWGVIEFLFRRLFPQRG